MPREKAKRGKAARPSTEARHRGGSVRRSDEGSVMELEQRDRVRMLRSGATGNRMKLPVRQSVKYVCLMGAV